MSWRELKWQWSSIRRSVNLNAVDLEVRSLMTSMNCPAETRLVKHCRQTGTDFAGVRRRRNRSRVGTVDSEERGLR